MNFKEVDGVFVVFCIGHEDFYLIPRLYSGSFSKVKLKDTICILFDFFNTLVTCYVISVISLLSSNDGVFITNLEHNLTICRILGSVDDERLTFMSYITIIVCFFKYSPAVYIRIGPAGYHGVVKFSCSIDTGSSSCESIFKFALIYNIVNGCDVDAFNH